ncbi:hypothetical protein MMC34_006627 [Xylographa carneopallida]|nr:hypothetical protein [Xylographa carneopallida]
MALLAELFGAVFSLVKAILYALAIFTVIFVIPCGFGAGCIAGMIFSINIIFGKDDSRTNRAGIGRSYNYWEGRSYSSERETCSLLKYNGSRTLSSKLFAGLGFLICYAALNLPLALYVAVFDSTKSWASLNWPIYWNLYLQCLKVFVVLLVDFILCGLACVVVSLGYYCLEPKERGFVQKYVESEEVSSVLQMVAKSARSAGVSMTLVLTVLLQAFVVITFFNIMVYSSRYGIFVRHGTVLNYFETYGFTVAWILFMLYISILATCMVMFIFAAIAGLFYGCSLLCYPKHNNGSGDLSWSELAFCSVVVILASAGVGYSYFTMIICGQAQRDMARKENSSNTTSSLNSTSNANSGPLNGAAFNSTSGMYHYPPLATEFKCLTESFYVFLLMLLGLSVFLSCSYAIKYTIDRYSTVPDSKDTGGDEIPLNDMGEQE